MKRTRICIIGCMSNSTVASIVCSSNSLVMHSPHFRTENKSGATIHEKHMQETTHTNIRRVCSNMHMWKRRGNIAHTHIHTPGLVLLDTSEACTIRISHAMYSYASMLHWRLSSPPHREFHFVRSLLGMVHPPF